MLRQFGPSPRASINHQMHSPLQREIDPGVRLKADPQLELQIARDVAACAIPCGAGAESALDSGFHFILPEYLNAFHFPPQTSPKIAR